jgi:hypothetical protein
MTSPVTRRLLCNRLINPIGFGCMSLSHGYGAPPPDKTGESILLRALSKCS